MIDGRGRENRPFSSCPNFRPISSLFSPPHQLPVNNRAILSSFFHIFRRTSLSMGPSLRRSSRATQTAAQSPAGGSASRSIKSQKSIKPRQTGVGESKEDSEVLSVGSLRRARRSTGREPTTSSLRGNSRLGPPALPHPLTQISSIRHPANVRSPTTS
jgi:hypothetical protein